jgi:hypothetical protein
MAKKARLKKEITIDVAKDKYWSIVGGELKRARGRPQSVQSLFRVVAEKIPYGFLDHVKKAVKEYVGDVNGVYIAHDSMGSPRYIGRGNIFKRLKTRRDAQVLELTYFSFYVVENRKHEREIETIMIRAAGPLLHFNNRKKRIDIEAGGIKDFEAGTLFIERQYRKGRHSSSKGKS